MNEMLEQPMAMAGDPATAAANDPLPESKWVWRRAFTFSLTAALLFGAYVSVGLIGQSATAGSETAIRGLVSITRISLGLIGLLILFYMLAPSAEQLTKLVQTGLALRNGVTFRSTATASTADGGKAEVTTQAGGDTEPPKEKEAPSRPSVDTGLPDIGAGPLPWEKGTSQ